MITIKNQTEMNFEESDESKSGESDDSEDKESDESEKKPTVKKRRRSYVEVKNAIQVKMFLKPLVQEKDTFTEQGEVNNVKAHKWCSSKNLAEKVIAKNMK